MDKYKGEDLELITPPKWQLLSTSFFPNKDLKKVKQLAYLYLEHDPDLICLTEVGGQESLENFNKHFLEDRYNVFIKASNSDRGIDLGYLVKKTLSLETELIAHTEAILQNGKKFARGVFELQLKKNGLVLFVNFLCHLKSKLDLKKNDFEGRTQRQSEVNYLTQLYLMRQKQFPSALMAISGDLNAVIYKDETEPELQSLLAKTQLLDVFEILDKPLSERLTFCYFDRKKDCFQMQLDYFLIPVRYKRNLIPSLTKILDFQNNPEVVYPRNYEEKLSLPSDHFPILCTIEIPA
jgi:hypothetical protein